MSDQKPTQEPVAQEPQQPQQQQLTPQQIQQAQQSNIAELFTMLGAKEFQIVQMQKAIDNLSQQAQGLYQQNQGLLAQIEELKKPVDAPKPDVPAAPVINTEVPPSPVVEPVVTADQAGNVIEAAPVV